MNTERIVGLWKDFIRKCSGFRTGISSHALQLLELSKVRQWSEDVVPTVSFNLRKVRKGNITLKIWDVAGMYAVVV